MFLQKPMLGTQLDRSDSLNNPVLDLLMNEGHGDRVNDLSGYGNHGTLYGFDFPPTVASGWNPGLDGVCLAFDGSGDYIGVPDSPSLHPTDAITIDVVMNASTQIRDYAGIVSEEISGNTNGWDIRTSIHTSTTTDIQFRCSNGTERVVGNTIKNNQWHRIIGVYDDYILELFVDGMSVDTLASTDGIGVNNSDLVVGALAYGLGNCFTGAIASVRVLPRAMSAFEIMQTQIDPYGVYLR